MDDRHEIRSLPLVTLAPHSACNCRCIMCDIWKENKDLKQLDENDIRRLLVSLKQLKTATVFMSGGEAMMHPNFFALCELLRAEGMGVVVLSTGLLVERHARKIVDHTNGLIVSVDGSEHVHDGIRRIPGAFRKLREGVRAVKDIDAHYRISARTVIQRANFADWPNIVSAAHEIGFAQISFTAADVLPTSFARLKLWGEERSDELLIGKDQLPLLKSIIETLIAIFADDFRVRYILETPEGIRRLYDYFAAFHGEANVPPVRCNVPWVSAVVEADGAVRPCFFHPPMGNIRDASLVDVINAPSSVAFRRNLDMEKDPICRKCVCQRIFNSSLPETVRRWTG